jgi:hypothetical protein
VNIKEHARIIRERNERAMRMRQLVQTEHGTLRDPQSGHEYPPDYPPGTHAMLDEAWRIIDTVKAGIMPMDVRCLLAGMICGAFDKLSTKGSSDNSRADQLAAALLWLRNHYAFLDESVKPRVLKVIDGLLDEDLPSLKARLDFRMRISE